MSERRIKTGKRYTAEAREAARVKATTHGQSKTSEYDAWQSAKARCHRKTHDQYSDYGGRGIRMCKRWLGSFRLFLHDMGCKPTSDHMLERRNNNGHYSPSNCCWATCKEQQSNRRSNRWIVFLGQRKTVTQWAEFLGVKPGAIKERLRRGFSIEAALTRPIRIKTKRT